MTTRLALTLTLALTACSSHLPQRESTVSIPVSWSQRHSFPTTSPGKDLQHWWTRFGDAQLTGLIRRGLDRNLDLAATATRVREASAARLASRSNLLPSLSYGASRSETTQGRNPSQSASSSQLETSWEADLFGRHRAGLRAADADLESARAQLSSARASLAAEIALAYFDYQSAQARLQVLRESTRSREQTLKLASWKKEAGQTDSLDLEQATSSYRQSLASQADLEQSAESARQSLALLLSIPENDFRLDTVPLREAPASLSIGIPMDTLRQRPDVRDAGLQVLSAAASRDAAAAERFPSLRLSGSIGSGSLDPLKAFDPQKLATSVLASISASIFDGGKIRANIESSDAALERAVAAYGQTVLTALSEVEQALLACRQSRARQRELEQAAGASANALTLARRRYETGVADFLNVLDAERTDLSNRDQLLTSRTDLLKAHVSLYRALGGGW